MSTSWLKCTNPQPSLEALAEALESAPVAEKSLAKQLREKNCQGREETIPHIYTAPSPSSTGAPSTFQGSYKHIEMMAVHSKK